MSTSATIALAYSLLFVLKSVVGPAYAISTDDFYIIGVDSDALLPEDNDCAQVTLSQPFPFHESNHSLFIVGYT